MLEGKWKASSAQHGVGGVPTWNRVILYAAGRMPTGTAVLASSSEYRTQGFAFSRRSSSPPASLELHRLEASREQLRGH